MRVPGLEAIWSVVYESVDRWTTIEGPRRAAALSHYALFSLFPAMLLALTIFGFVLGDEAATRERMLDSLGSAMPRGLRGVLDETLTSFQQSRSARGVSAVVSVLGLLFTTTGAFVELESALKRTFGVKPRPTCTLEEIVRDFFRSQLVGLALFLAFGIVVLASVVLGFVVDSLESVVPTGGADLRGLWRLVEAAGSLALFAGALGLLFRVTSERRLSWPALLPGAAITTTFFYALKRLFSFYVAKLTSYSAYGIVGVVLMLATWIFLMSNLLLFGAQLTVVLAERMEKRRARRAAIGGAVRHA
jgi:membrane protein